MPPKKVLRQVLFDIESVEHFNEKISEANNKLICK